MTYTIHPVWGTTRQPQLIRYGLYKVSTDGEQEIAQAGRFEPIEALRQKILHQHIIIK